MSYLTLVLIIARRQLLVGVLLSVFRLQIPFMTMSKIYLNPADCLCLWGPICSLTPFCASVSTGSLPKRVLLEA